MKWIFQDLGNPSAKYSNVYRGLFVEDKLIIKIVQYDGLYSVYRSSPPQLEVGKYRTLKAAESDALLSAGINTSIDVRMK